MPLGMATTTKSTNAQCCGCCKDYGTTTITMTSTTNFVVNGQEFSMKGVVDNTKGEEDISLCRMMLKQCRIMVSSRGKTTHFVDKQWGMHGINQPIGKGQTKEFQFTNTIPAEIVNSTAIGRVTAIYFLLHF